MVNKVQLAHLEATVVVGVDFLVVFVDFVVVVFVVVFVFVVDIVVVVLIFIVVHIGLSNAH